MVNWLLESINLGILILGWIVIAWLAIGLIKTLLFILIIFFGSYVYRNVPNQFPIPKFTTKDYWVILGLIVVNILLGPIPVFPSIM